MKVAELLELRRQNWQELEDLCSGSRLARAGRSKAENAARFAALYRATCADLALADAYHLPPGTVVYLQRLVSRAHNRLHRSQGFAISKWAEALLVTAPRRIFADRCMHVAFVLFWGVFLLSASLAYFDKVWPEYTDAMISTSTQMELERNFREDITGRDPSLNFRMAGFYIQHNTGIGLRCFVSGLLIIPGLYTLIFNAAVLGGSFGYMAREPVSGPNFFHFVTAHGPFELTAIVLSAGAGLRLGVSWLITDEGEPGLLGVLWRASPVPGLSRKSSLIRAGKRAMPIMGAAIVLFILAAMTEGFLSPSSAPYWVKAAFAILSSGLLMFYFLVLGFPWDIVRET